RALSGAGGACRALRGAAGVQGDRAAAGAAEGVILTSPGANPGLFMPALCRASMSSSPKQRRGWPGHRRAEATPFFERLCPAMTTEEMLNRAALQHHVHVDDDAVGVTRGGGDEDVLHQPAVFLRTRLEFRRRSEIDQLGIDRLAALQLLQQVDGTEADTLVLDIDHRAVIGLEGVSGFEIDQLIGADDLEVRAERQHLAVDIIAPHLAADDGNDAADAVADVAGGCHVSDLSSDGEDVFGLKLRRHDGLTCVSAATGPGSGRRSGSRAGSG